MVVVVEGGTHSWLLKDPETLPAILRELFDSPRGRSDRARDFARLGLSVDASADEIEAVLYDPDAPVLALTPEIDPSTMKATGARPRYRWHIDRPR